MRSRLSIRMQRPRSSISKSSAARRCRISRTGNGRLRLGQLATVIRMALRRKRLRPATSTLLTTSRKLDDANRSKLAAFYKAAGPIAYQMRQIKDPEQRKALLAQARPVLEATGVDPKAIDGFDVTNDTALDGLIAANSTVDQLIERGKVVWHQQGESPSFATDSMGRPIGSQNDPATGGGGSGERSLRSRATFPARPASRRSRKRLCSCRRAQRPDVRPEHDNTYVRVKPCAEGSGERFTGGRRRKGQDQGRTPSRGWASMS
jgi:hypothetical protein